MTVVYYTIAFWVSIQGSSRINGTQIFVSPAYLRHVSPASLEYRFFFDVGKEVAQNL